MTCYATGLDFPSFGNDDVVEEEEENEVELICSLLEELTALEISCCNAIKSTLLLMCNKEDFIALLFMK